MKYATASEHRDFFRKHQLIEFENLLKPDQIQKLNEGIKNALALRLNITPEKAQSTSPEKLFLVGRDIWRADFFLKKTILQSSFAEIFSELVDEKPIRIAYDQFLPGVRTSIFSNQEEKYRRFLKTSLSLKQMSCYQGILGGLMLCLDHEMTQERREGLSFFPLKPGNGIFFQPDLPINFEPLLEYPKSSYLLIAYCHQTTVYCLQTDDPHTHDCKQYGYGFGDRLNDLNNPIIYR